MPNDAKIGLVVGVGLVIVAAIVFFRKEATATTVAAAPAPTIEQTTSAQGRSQGPTPAKNATFTPNPQDGTHAPASLPINKKPGEPTLHIVAAGDTLFSLAQRYYGDGERFAEIYRANREVLPNPDRLPVGTTIRIP